MSRRQGGRSGLSWCLERVDGSVPPARLLQARHCSGHSSSPPWLLFSLCFSISLQLSNKTSIQEFGKLLSTGLMLQRMCPAPYWGVMYPVETVWCRAGGCFYTAVLILAVHRPAGASTLYTAQPGLLYFNQNHSSSTESIKMSSHYWKSFTVLLQLCKDPKTKIQMEMKDS